MFKVILDGIVHDAQPDGVTELDERIYLSKDLNIYLNEIQGTLTFHGDAYEYLKTIRDTNYCTSVPILIKQLDIEAGGTNQYKTIFEGFIFISDIDIDRIHEKLTTELVDNGYIGRIDNNKNIEMELLRQISKNGVDISSMYSIITNAFFTEIGGSSTSNTQTAITVLNAFKALIAFVTDGVVKVKSDFFDTGGEGEDFKITKLGSNFQGPFIISFINFWRDIYTVFNQFAAIEIDTDGSPVFRIEKKSFFKKSNIIQLNNIVELSETINKSNIPSKVKLGSFKADPDAGMVPGDPNDNSYRNPILQPYITHQEETINSLLDCNDENEIDLTTKTLIYDNLIWHDTIINDESAYLDDFFLFDNVDFWLPPTADSGLFYINKPLINSEIIKRYTNLFCIDYDPASKAGLDQTAFPSGRQELNSGDNTLLFNETGTPFYDNFGNVQPSGIFNVTVTQNYRVFTHVIVKADDDDYTFQFKIVVTGSNNNSYYLTVDGNPATRDFFVSQGDTLEIDLEVPEVFLQNGDTIKVVVNRSASTFDFAYAEQGSYMQVDYAINSIVRSGCSNEDNNEVTATLKVEKTVWDQFKAAPFSQLNLNYKENRFISGYNTEFVRNIASGDATLKMIGNVKPELPE